MDYCKCYLKTNIKCATCDKPFKPPQSKSEQIEELRKLIKKNVHDNIIYKMEIRDLEDDSENDEVSDTIKYFIN